MDSEWMDGMVDTKPDWAVGLYWAFYQAWLHAPGGSQREKRAAAKCRALKSRYGEAVSAFEGWQYPRAHQYPKLIVRNKVRSFALTSRAVKPNRRGFIMEARLPRGTRWVRNGVRIALYNKDTPWQECEVTGPGGKHYWPDGHFREWEEAVSFADKLPS